MTYYKRRFLITVIVLIVVFLLSYLGMAFYYKGSFIYGTWINNIYCTGKNVEEVNQLLLEGTSVDKITICFAEGEKAEINLRDIVSSYDYTYKLEEYLHKQTPLTWWKALLNQNKIELSPTILYNEDNLKKALQRLPQFQKIGQKPEDEVTIEKTDKGYEILNYDKFLLDKDMAYITIGDALSKGETLIDLEEKQCYAKRKETKQTKEIYELWIKMEAALDIDIVYDMGDGRYELINHKVLSDWLVTDDNGEFVYDEDNNFQFSEEAVEEFVKNLAEKYDTLGGTRQFESTRGDVVEVTGGTYGNLINQKAEIAFIKDCLLNHKNATRVPEYKVKAKCQGMNDIGDTYIEIDMTEQMMYYYVDGEIFVQTPVVTGNARRRWDTPSGTNFVYGKQKSRILRGATYASFVNYWMPVNGNIGIHDAPWRKEYGGEVYMTDGSHGCINTPYDEMSVIYENAEIGTPVIMFY